MENEKYRSTSMSHYVEEDSDWNGAEQSYDQDFFDEDYEYDAEKQVTWVGRIVSIMGLLLSLVIVGTTGYLLNSSEGKSPFRSCFQILRQRSFRIKRRSLPKVLQRI